MRDLKKKSGLYIMAMATPVLLMGTSAKGLEARCASKSGNTVTDVTPAKGGDPGVFGGVATISAPPEQTPIVTTPDKTDLKKLVDEVDVNNNASLAAVLAALSQLCVAVPGDLAAPPNDGQCQGPTPPNIPPMPPITIDDKKNPGKCAWQYKGFELIPFGDSDSKKETLGKIKEALEGIVGKAGDSFKGAKEKIDEAKKLLPGQKEFDVMFIYICVVTEKGDNTPDVGTVVDKATPTLHLGNGGNGEEDAVDFNAGNGAQLIAGAMTAALKAKDEKTAQKIRDEAMAKIKDAISRSDACKKAINKNKPKKPCCGTGADT